jgi:hypothetical protein
MYKHSNEYFPIINWNQKYFNKSNQFVNFLFEQSNVLFDSGKITDVISTKDKFTKVKSKKKNKSTNINNENLDNMISTQINSHNEFNSQNQNQNKNNNWDYDDNCNNNNKENENENKNVEDDEKYKYQELVTNEDYAIYISEAVTVNDTLLGKKKNVVLSDSKKKIKKSKNIFVTKNHDDCVNSTQFNLNKENNNDPLIDDKDSSVFNKTEKISKNDIDDINNNLKLTSSLDQIQSYALKLGINIFSGATKTGKPKNKTKSELVTEIKNALNKL